jgi:serine/threonine protein kinase
LLLRIFVHHADHIELNLFPQAMKPRDQSATAPEMSRSVKEWRGGSKYNKIGCIGKGAFATVYKITSKFDGVPFAAKEIEKRRFVKDGRMDGKVEREMEIMSKIHHVSELRKKLRRNRPY